MELDWSLLLLLFFVLLAVVLASGMPVAFGFLTLNILGLYFFMAARSRCRCWRPARSPPWASLR